MEFPRITIPEQLAHIAETTAEDRGFTFVADDGKSEAYYSFRQLGAAVARRANALARLGLRPGSRVVLAIPGSEQFVLSFLGAMHAGLVPVPIYPPMTLGKLGSYLENCRHVIERSEADVLVTTGQIKLVLGSLLGHPLRLITTVEDLPETDEELVLQRRSADDPGFIQFTSGSTSRPKGVVLTHGNLAANAHCIMRLGLNATPEDRGCTWLPFYHDMGLIGFVLSPLYTDTPVAFIPPLLFLKRPAEWLRLISKHRGSISFGPNFAYGLATKRIRDEQIQGIDLSSWRIAGCGAEPIQMATLQAFADRFAAYGFRDTAFMPCFGMAESTLAVTFFDTKAPLHGDVVSLEKMADNRAVTTDASADDAVAMVNCGKPFAGHELRILDEHGHPVGEREVGQIALRGPSVMAGYYNDPEATQEAMPDGWLRTGDLGYTVDGDLYVCGRIKDLIIVAGKNYYPTDIEWSASEVDGVRRGNVVAFGLAPAGGGDEQVVICAEVKLAGQSDTPEGRKALQHSVTAYVTSTVGIKPTHVVLLEPGALPKTSSGKLQRRRARDMYLAGELHSNHEQEGKLDLVRHLAKSQWGLLKSRIQGARKG